MHKGAIKFIEELDNEGFNKYCDETGATICGRDAISVLISAVKEIGVKEVKLLKYYTSGDITEDYTNAVGYGSILFR